MVEVDGEGGVEGELDEELDGGLECDDDGELDALVLEGVVGGGVEELLEVPGPPGPIRLTSSA